MAPTLRPRRQLPGAHVLKGVVDPDWNLSTQAPVPSRGLDNPAFECYSNSVIEALLHLPIFVNWLQTHQTPINGNVAHAMYRLSRHYWDKEADSGDVERELAYLRKCFRSAGWSETGQQDPSHFYAEFVQILKDQQAGPKPDETLDALFNITIGTKLRCPNCREVSRPTDAAPYLNVPMEEASDLETLLKSFRVFGAEVREGATCSLDKCTTKPDRVATRYIQQAPEILMVQLGRFSQQFRVGEQTEGEKLEDEVTFPESLNLTSFFKLKEPLRYQLVSVVHHIGDLGQGHYVNYARGPNGAWTRMDNHRSKPTTAQEATRNRGGFTPYLLFYQRTAMSGLYWWPQLPPSQAIAQASSAAAQSSVGTGTARKRFWDEQEEARSAAERAVRESRKQKRSKKS